MTMSMSMVSTNHVHCHCKTRISSVTTLRRTQCMKADVIPKVQLRPQVSDLMVIVVELYKEKKQNGCDPCLGHYPRTRVPRFYV
jgi:hypothetical protein